MLLYVFVLYFDNRTLQLSPKTHSYLHEFAVLLEYIGHILDKRYSHAMYLNCPEYVSM